MAGLAPIGPNAEQIQYWNEQGHRWVSLQDFIDPQIEPLGTLAMDRAGIGHGHNVLDVGCGCGQTTLDLAGRVGPLGSVSGIDISTIMLRRARERADAAGIEHAHFENADAQTHTFPPASFDRIFSRFGVMFFSDPPAAFANLRAALRPDGVLAFVCWQALQKNPWMLVPLTAAAQHIPLSPPPPAGTPGPFAFADPDRVHGILDAAGFRDIGMEPVERVLTVGGGADLDETVFFMLQMGPAGSALRLAGPQHERAVAQAVRAALEPYVTPDGVRMGGAAWVVTARP